MLKKNRFSKATMGDEQRLQKRKTASAGNSEEEKADRLSDLPTPLLHHILSFLPTREAVKTCVLSRIWKDVWTSIPVLNFSDRWFGSPPPTPATPTSSDDEVEQQQLEDTQFPDFVERVLIHRDGSNLQKFRLRFNVYKWGGLYADRWLCYAAKHFVQQIELRFVPTSYPALQYCPPHNLFTCESLIDLSLTVDRGLLKLPTCINLPNLQSLKLSYFEVPDNCLQRLFCCCPKLKIFNLTECYLPDTKSFDVSCCSCLESLILKRNKLYGTKTISISAPKLKKLTLRSYVIPYIYCLLKISAPNLLYLECNDFMATELCIEKLPNLLAAVVYWYLYENSIYGNIGLGLEFLKGLEQVRTLRLYASSIEILPRAKDLPTSFANLKFLELVINKVGVDELKAISCLLKFCPSIETLIIQIKGGHDGRSWESDCFPYECKPHNLKKVEIRQFEGSHIELNLIKLLLKSAMVLERMIVTAPKLDLQKRKEIKMKLLTYPRASSRMLILLS